MWNVAVEVLPSDAQQSWLANGQQIGDVIWRSQEPPRAMLDLLVQPGHF